MSALIDNIKRLAALVRGEKKSGGNTAERVGGLFEEIATELDKKYDRTESDQLMNAHNTGEASHLNIQQKLIQLIDETREALLAADHDITQELAAHTGIKAIHKTSEEIRAEIVDQDIPATLARVSYVQAQRTEILNIAKQLVTSEIAEVIGGAPDALNALNELAAAINNDPNFAASIMALINAKADLIHTHTKAQITDFPTSMPASDVYSWAKQPTKPAYSAAEVGASPANHNHAGTYQPAGSYAPANHTHEGVYQPAGSYSPANHNHAGTYQPAGNYAPANHGHGASAITEEANKLFMTSAERSKLADIEAGANNYTHPGSHPASMILEETNKHFITDAERKKIEGPTIANPGGIPKNANLNNYTTAGSYYCASDTDANTISNRPWAGSFSLLVLLTAGVIQIYIPYKAANPSAIFFRKYYNGWGNWFQVNTTLYS